MEPFIPPKNHLAALRTVSKCDRIGRVTEILGPTLRADLPGAAIGEIVSIKGAYNDHLAQIVGFSGTSYSLAPLTHLKGIRPNAEVKIVRRSAIGHERPEHLIGTAMNSLGEIIERFAPQPQLSNASVYTEPSSPLSTSPLLRTPISNTFLTGVKAIDLFTTLGQGQRIGVFAEPGVGKSTLLSAIARSSSAQVNVIALIGERKREIGEIIYETLDAETRSRSIIVISSSDDTPRSRILAGIRALEISEAFAAQGKDVLLLMDSLTRLVRAYREAGLAAGESPVRHGYPPSAFSELPRLLERAGNFPSASITGVFTVLQSGELNEDPFVEETKSLLDGHILLSRELAERGIYPAIDPIRSISRLQNKLLTPDQLAVINRARGVLAEAERNRELILLGGLEEGRELIARAEQIERFLAAENIVGMGGNPSETFAETINGLRLALD